MPENPRYMGEDWHVHGLVNEGIIAAGLYCYDQSNITECTTAFRMAVADDVERDEDDDEEGIEAVYGLTP